MTRIHQLIKHPRKLKKIKSSSPALKSCSQKKAICESVYTVNPKKPNSAERKIAKVKLFKGKSILAYIPGEGHRLQQHSIVLVRGGKVKDLPGVRYHLIRGPYDLHAVLKRSTSRSKYGRKQIL